jgi:ADP-ribose pyrophosphatase YjhB (NUDIX family)
MLDPMARGPLPQDEYESIFARVPRLTVEVVLAHDDQIFLTRRSSGPRAGLWHLPGGTVRFGEPVADAVARIGRDELGVELVADGLLGVIEYPSHLEAGIDWPVGLAFSCRLEDRPPMSSEAACWFSTLPAEIHDEQSEFLLRLGVVAPHP